MVIDDYYTTLGVQRTASKQEISAAYKALITKYHPDKHDGNELRDLAAEKVRQLNEAYSILSDSQSRARYDAGADVRLASTARGPMSQRGLASRLAIWTALLATLYGLFQFGRNPKLIGAFALVLLIARLMKRFRPS